MAHGTARIGNDHYRTEISVSGHDLIADEGPALGGKNMGPAPYDLLAITGLDEQQKARMADIAERTPVTLTLKGGLPIDTRLA